jgi:hypothetical protein
MNETVNITSTLSNLVINRALLHKFLSDGKYRHLPHVVNVKLSKDTKPQQKIFLDQIN